MLKKLLLSAFLTATSLTIISSVNAMNDEKEEMKISGAHIKEILQSDELVTPKGKYTLLSSSGEYHLSFRTSKENQEAYLNSFLDDELYTGVKNLDGSYRFEISQCSIVPTGLSQAYDEKGNLLHDGETRFTWTPKKTETLFKCNIDFQENL